MEKFVALTPELAKYVAEHHTPCALEPILSDLRIETEALGEISMMQISPEQGTFLSLLILATGARTVVEVGTFTGYSAIRMASSLPAEGKLWCFDQSSEWTGIARRYWERAGVSSKIELVVGDAKESLKNWQPPQQIDFAFIDADKSGYATYYELLLPHLRPNALIAFDNMLRDGRVINPSSEDDRALARLNDSLVSDPRLQCVLLSLADGIMLCRKK